jgi:hypothetical protein
MRPSGQGGVSGCTTAMGDGRTVVEETSGIGVWDGRAAWPTMGRGAVGHGAAANKRAVGEGVRTALRGRADRAACGRESRTDTRVGSLSLFDGPILLKYMISCFFRNNGTNSDAHNTWILVPTNPARTQTLALIDF